MADFLDNFIGDLLHLTDGRSNKLIDIGDISCSTNLRSNEKTFLLSCPMVDAGAMMLDTIRTYRGKASNHTVLANSSQVPSAVIGKGNKWDWKDLNGATKADVLHKFIKEAYSELNLKGNNPLFLGVGSMKWNVVISDKLETVYSPLLIFPIRLVRGAPTSPVEIEFVDDEAYFNPCFISMMRDVYPNVANNFPHPNGDGADFDEALNLDTLSDGSEYFDKVDSYLDRCGNNDGQQSVFELDRNTVAISLYNHSDICVYYDVRRNKDKIYSNPLIAKIFGLQGIETDEQTTEKVMVNDLKFVLSKDSVQEQLISRVVNGESLVIKGPPGTGKTLTIANMLATLLAQGKRVMIASKKVSALTEVSNKLPENLRKFIMMLAYETEKQAANINPTTIKDDFRATLRYRREYTRDTTLAAKLNTAKQDVNDARLDLTKYFAVMYAGSTIAGKNYYDALDTYYEHTDLPTVNFAKASEIERLTSDQLQRVKTLFNEAGKHFAKMSGTKHIKYSPWLNIAGLTNIDSELYPLYENICNQLPAISKAIDDVKQLHGDVSLDKLSIGALATLAGQTVYDVNALENIVIVKESEKLLTELTDVLAAYQSKLCYANSAVRFTTDTDSDEAKSVFDVKADSNLTVGQLVALDENKQLFYKNGAFAIDDIALDKLRETVDTIAELKVKARKCQLEAITVFDKPLDGKQIKLILKSYEILKEYVGKQKAGKFDFKALHAVKKLTELTSDPMVSFEKIVNATLNYNEYYLYNNQIATFMRLVATIFGISASAFTDEQYELLELTLNRSKALDMTLEHYLKEVSVSRNWLKSANTVHIVSDGVTVGQLLGAFDLHMVTLGLAAAIARCCEAASVDVPKGDLHLCAVATVAALSLGNLSELTNASEVERRRIIQALVAIDKTCTDKLNLVIQLLSGIKDNYVVNYYSTDPYSITLADLQYFATQALDRSVIGSAIRYYEIVDEINKIVPATQLFSTLESGEYTVDSKRFGDLFEHSFVSIVLVNLISNMGNARNGLGHRAATDFEKFDHAEQTVLELNAKAIEQACLEKINPNDSDFGFLANDKGAKLTMRGFFKAYASAVWKLKRCFILSPSTASVLFRSDVYNDFDVVIIDEASQLEPVYMLPILIRAKQCVLVGDEHQMPPITHFKAKNNSMIEDYERELTIDKDISALSLALVNQAFDTTELVCHYRSNTESLIAFSQRAFYPFMHTFPAAIPFGEGLGFVDVYVEDGKCDDGVNLAEVDKTVQLLKRHFDKYYDKENERLCDNGAIGVVAFGESQLAAIKRRVDADEELYAAISKAQNAVDVGDKAVFFRTIESVQGQETDHLILSLTYGKDKNGKVQNRFGELNRDDFGKCIFNVAVTRAKSSVTLVHSVQPYELDRTSRIGFIVEYMRLVRQFSQDSCRQFVSNPIDKGSHFVDDVVYYVKSQGIAPERIVVGYGVTDGSVNIPIAVLSEDMKQAVLGIWCELPTGNKYNYLDYNLRYYNSLVSRKWKLHRVSIHEWFDNSEAEKQQLKYIIEQVR